MYLGQSSYSLPHLGLFPAVLPLGLSFVLLPFPSLPSSHPQFHPFSCKWHLLILRQSNIYSIAYRNIFFICQWALRLIP